MVGERTPGAKQAGSQPWRRPELGPHRRWATAALASHIPSGTGQPWRHPELSQYHRRATAPLPGRSSRPSALSRRCAATRPRAPLMPALPGHILSAAGQSWRCRATYPPALAGPAQPHTPARQSTRRSDRRSDPAMAPRLALPASRRPYCCASRFGSLDSLDYCDPAGPGQAPGVVGALEAVAAPPASRRCRIAVVFSAMTKSTIKSSV